MNLNQIISMVTRMFVRKGVNWGINKGTGMLARRAKPGAPASPAELVQVNHARDAAKRARKAAAITRRIGR